MSRLAELIKWRVVLNDNQGKTVLAIGDISYDFPKLLAVGDLPKDDKQVDNLLKYLLTVASSFTIDPPSAKDLPADRLLETLIFISSSHIPSYRFLLGRIVPEKKEVTNPSVIGSIHRLLKRPEAIIPEPVFSDEIKGESVFTVNDQTSLPLALTMAALLTAPTRHGAELRQALAQTILWLHYNLRCSANAEDVARMLAAIVADSYYWYSTHLKTVGEPFKAELRYLAYEWQEPPQRATLEEIKRGIVCSLNDSFAENASKLVLELKRLLGLKQETLFGRLDQLKGVLSGNKADEIVTVATGQWGVAQAHMMAELTGARQIHVIYTQNVAEQRLLEEFVREQAKNMGINTNFQVTYYLASATDAQLINALASSLLNKAGSNTLVVAQGPSTIALPLYAGAKAKDIHAFLI